MGAQPDETITFETKSELEAFMRGILWERDKYAADVVCNPGGDGTYEVKLFRIHDVEKSFVG
jgi:hypothetical protein